MYIFPSLFSRFFFFFFSDAASEHDYFILPVHEIYDAWIFFSLFLTIQGCTVRTKTNTKKEKNGTDRKKKNCS